MEIAIGIILGIILGAAFVKITSRGKLSEIDSLSKENILLTERLTAKEKEVSSLNEERMNLMARNSGLQSKIETQENLANELKSQIITEREYANKIIETSNDRIKK